MMSVLPSAPRPLSIAAAALVLTSLDAERVDHGHGAVAQALA